jgi:EAL domain-containing protein (putative c-di-GMP-specific phosphodiesterase class I)
VRVEDLRIIGAEVLLRWTHPNLGPISPARFVPLAEEAGLIGEIGRWVMQKGCEQACTWRDAGRPDLRLGVNVSARQFTSFGFIDEVGSILASSGFPAECLEIEITESIAMRHSEVIGEVFRALDAIGVRIAIDDFGTGHSSLERLGTFPIHTLKVAKPFIDHVGVDDDRSLIARSIILLANSLRLNVIAEGVETEPQLAFLREHECPEMQGYLFSRPVTAEEFGALLEREGSAESRSQ